MVTVRKACRGDVPSIAALHKGEGWCYDEEVVLNDYWDDDFDKESIIVAEVGGRVVGTIELAKAYKARFGFFGVLRRFVIHPEYRGRSIGRKMMDYAIEQARRIGCAAIELSVDSRNVDVHKYYLSLGFSDDRAETIMVKLL